MPESVPLMAMLATGAESTRWDGPYAVALAEKANEPVASRDAGILDTLAAVYAEEGRFEEAVRTAQVALTLVKQAGQTEPARRIEERLELYRAGQPYREQFAPAR